MILTASEQQRQALGCGLKITAFRVLMAMMHLKSTVEVGFVIGVSDKMTPIGSAISTRLRSGNFANDANRTFILDVVVGELRRAHVLEDFVFHDSELGLLNREAGERLSLFEASQDHRLDDAINILLSKLSKNSSRSSGLIDQSLQICNPFVAEAFGGDWYLNSLHYCFTRVHYYPLCLSVGVHCL